MNDQLNSLEVCKSDSNYPVISYQIIKYFNFFYIYSIRTVNSKR